MKISLNIVLLFCFVLSGQNVDIFDNDVFQITHIVVAGNKRTKESIIRREMDIEEGHFIHKKTFNNRLLKNRNRIFNIGLFVDVALTCDTSVANTTKIYVLVTERWYTIPTIVFELADRSFNEWWYQRNKDLNRVNYGFGLTQNNIRGRNETLKLNLQSGFTKNLSGSYTIPYLDRAKTLGLNVGGGYSENKQMLVYNERNKQVFIKSEKLLFTKSNVYATLSYRKSFFTTHRLNYDFAAYYASDSVLQQNPNFFNNFRNRNHVNTMVYNFIHDKRNIQAYPTQGHLSMVEVKQNGLFRSDYFKNTAFTVTHARYYELGHEFYFTNKSKILISSNDNIPFYNLRTLGYSNDYVRGYDLYVIDASSYFYTKTNIRKKILQRQIDLGKLMPLPQFRSFPISIYLNTFADIGYGYKRKYEERNALLLNRSLEGWGIGIDIVTAYDVVVRTEYSFNELGERRLFFYVSTDVVF